MELGGGLLASPVGRSVEADALQQLASEVATGRKRGALLLGPSGIGKTTLLNFVHDYCQRNGFFSVRARTPGVRALPPSYPADVVAASLLKVSVDPRLGELEAGVTERQLLTLLEQIGRSTPLAILIDDLDAAPRFGIEWLLANVRAADCAALLVSTMRVSREVEVDSFSWLPESTGDISFDHLLLKPLTFQATRELAEQVLRGSTLPSLNDVLFEKSRGNPLLAKEIIRSWQRDGVIDRAGEHWGITDWGGANEPSTLRDLVRSRLLRLETSHRNLLLVMALLGRPSGYTELAAILGINSDQRLIEDLSHLQDCELVTSENEVTRTFQLTHPQIAVTVMHEVGNASIRCWHQRIASHLREEHSKKRGCSAAELAAHSLAALREPDDIVAIIERAAQEAQASGNHEHTAAWFRRLASRLSDEKKRNALVKQAFATLHFAPKEAAELFSIALQSPNVERSQVLLGRAQALRRQGQFELALADADDAFAVATSEATSIEALHTRAVLKAILGDAPTAESILRDLTARTIGSEFYVRVIGHLAQVRFCNGNLREARLMCLEAYEACDDREYSSYLRANLAWEETLVGNWERAEQLFVEAVKAAAATNDRWNLSHLYGGFAKLQAWRGEIAMSLDLARRATQLSAGLENPAALLDATGSLVLALLSGGNAEQGVEQWQKTEALLRSRLEPREVSQTMVSVGESQLILANLGQARANCGRARDNLHTAKVWEEAVDRLEAQIELADGNPLVAVAILRPWIEAPGQVVFEHARALEVAAQAYLASRDRTMAQQCAKDALDLYTQLGAARRAEQLEKWMRERLRGPGRPRMRLPGGLTEREHEVLRHLITGRTNKDIARALTLSVSTVNKHVEHIISKAGVSRRTELVTFAQRLDDPVSANERAGTLSPIEGR